MDADPRVPAGRWSWYVIIFVFATGVLEDYFLAIFLLPCRLLFPAHGELPVP